MIQYTKIQSNGNNFLLLDNRTLSLSDAQLSALTKRDSDIKNGVGADGLLIIETSETEDFKMRIFNSDGSEGEMCGNGARCIARYAFDHGIASEIMQFETLAGPIRAEILEDGVRIGFGTLSIEDGLETHMILVNGETVYYRFLTVGVPHVVIFMEENRQYRKEELRQIGYALDYNHAVFKNGTNVNFVRHLGGNRIEATTYERGVEDLTTSCGTGSSASAAVSLAKYGIASPIEVVNPGGVNIVDLEPDTEKSGSYRIGLKGVPHYVARVQCAALDEEEYVLI